MTALLKELTESGKTGLYLGGEWLAGSDEMAVIDPATEDVLVEVGLADATHADSAVASAYEAQPLWSAKAPRDRAEILRQTFESMRRREEDLAELIVLENGKSFTDALGEVRYAAEFFRWFSEEASRVGGEIRTAPGGDKRIMSLRQPVGVSVMITPWNFPAAMATRKLGPALAAGCTAIVKPASDTPLTTLAIVHLMEEAGLPKGVVNVVIARVSSRRCFAIRESGSSLSPARPRWARRFSRSLPTRFCGCRWSWAATRLSWCSRTQTWTPPSKGRWWRR
jgi:succinate-semialdehyde dehydrogenase / glutarate-semialdehyde dehydrogenase